MEKLTPQIDGAYPNAQVTYDPHPIVGDAYANCRLILTPISAISDEDAVEVARIFHKSNIGMLDVSVSGGRKVISSLFECEWISAVISMHEIQHIIDYLRSRNYDLGYMGIRSLIDADIAISSTDKTETK